MITMGRIPSSVKYIQPQTQCCKCARKIKNIKISGCISFYFKIPYSDFLVFLYCIHSVNIYITFLHMYSYKPAQISKLEIITDRPRWYGKIVTWCSLANKSTVQLFYFSAFLGMQELWICNYWSKAVFDEDRYGLYIH